MVVEGEEGPAVSTNLEDSSKAPLTYQFYQGTTTTRLLLPQHHRFHISPHHHHHQHHSSHHHLRHHPPVHTGKSPSTSPLHSPSTVPPAMLHLTSARRVTEGALPTSWEAQLGSAQRGVVIGPTKGGEDDTIGLQELNHPEMNPPSVMMHRPTTGGVDYRLHHMNAEPADPADPHLQARVHPMGLFIYGRDPPEVPQNLCMRDMAQTTKDMACTTTSTVTSNSENKDVPKSLPLKKRKYVTEEPSEVIESPTEVMALLRQAEEWQIPQVHQQLSRVVLNDVDRPIGHSNDVPSPSMPMFPTMPTMPTMPVNQMFSMHQPHDSPRGMVPHYVTSNTTNNGMSLASRHRIVSLTEPQQTNIPLDFSSGSNRTLHTAGHCRPSLRAPTATSVIRTPQVTVASHELNEMRKMSTFSHIVNKLSAQHHDSKFGSEEFGAQLKRMAAAAFASRGGLANPQQRMMLGSLNTKPSPSLSPITPPTTTPPFLRSSMSIADLPKDINHHPHLKRKVSIQPSEKPKVFIGTKRMHTEAMSGRKAGRDGTWHPDGGGKVRFVTTNIDSSMKQPQTRLGGWAGPAGWEKDEVVIKRRVGNVADGGAGVEGETMLPSPTEAEAAKHEAGAGAAEVKDEESSPSEALHINPQDSPRMLQECSLAVRPDEDGDLPLHVAVVQGNLKTIHKLIKMMSLKSVTIDYCNFLRQTPLHLAVITKQPEVIHTLLGFGASPNYSDRVGNTSVHLAVKHQSLSCLDTIIEHAHRKPNLNQKNFEGLTPLHVAVQMKDEKLTDAELELTKMDMMKKLLVSGAEADITDGKSGRTPLHHAVETQQIKLVEMLLEHHSKVNIQSFAGNTALHTASERNYKNIMTLLMHHGADTTIKNANHETYNSVSKETKPSVSGQEASFSHVSPTIRIPKVEKVENVEEPVAMKSYLKRGRIVQLKSLDIPSISPANVSISSPTVQHHRRSPLFVGAHSAVQLPSEPISLRTTSVSLPTKGIGPLHGIKCERQVNLALAGQINLVQGSKPVGHIMQTHVSHVDHTQAVKDQPSVKSEKLDTQTLADSEHCLQQKSPVGPSTVITSSVMPSDNMGTHKICHSPPTDSQRAFPQLSHLRVGRSMGDDGANRHHGPPAPISSLTSMVNHLQRTGEPITLRVEQTSSQTSPDPQARKVKVSGTVYLPKKDAPALMSNYEAVMHQKNIEQLRNHSGLSLRNLPGVQHKETEINDGKAIPSNSELPHTFSGLQQKGIDSDSPEATHPKNPDMPQIVVPHRGNKEQHSQTIITNDAQPSEECTKDTSMHSVASVIVSAGKLECKSHLTSKAQSVDEVMTAIINTACLTEKLEELKENKLQQHERCKVTNEVPKVSAPKSPVEVTKEDSTDSIASPTLDKLRVVNCLVKQQSPDPEKKAVSSVLPNIPEAPDIFPPLVISETEEATVGHGKKRRKINEIGIMLASSSQKKIWTSSNSAMSDEKNDKPNTKFELKADSIEQSKRDECTVSLLPCPNVIDTESNPTDSSETVLNEFTGQLIVKEKCGSSGDITKQDNNLVDIDNPVSSSSSMDNS